MATETIDQANADLQTEEVWVDAQQNDGTWKPENEGDNLTGEYIGTETTTSGKTLYIIVNDEMQKVKVWGSKIIDSYFNHKTGVNLGERVKITFLGRVMIEGKFNDKNEPAYFNNYRVQHTKGKHANSKFSAEEQAKIDADDAAGIKQAEEEMKAEKDEIDVKKIPW